MVTLFWLLVALVAWPYLLYPLLLVAASLVRGRPVERAPQEPAVSVIIAAYNEEKHLAAKIENTLALDYPPALLEIIVVSDGSTDGTAGIARSFAGRGVRLLDLPRQGKTAAQEAGVAAAKGEMLVFTDVTAHCPAETLRLFAENLADPTVGLVSCLVDFGEPTGATSRGLRLRQRYDNFVRERQSRLSSLFGASGALYAVRRAAYRPLPPMATSDFVASLWALEMGYRTVLDHRVVAWLVRQGPGAGAEWARRVRIVQGGAEGLWLARGLLNPLRRPGLALSLLSARLMRYLVMLWLAGLAAVTTALAVQEGGWYVWAAGLQAAFYLTAVGGWAAERLGWRLPLVHIPFYFCLVHLAALAGLGRAIAGRRLTTWETRR